MATYALALDAGGTATRCWLVARDGTVAGTGRGGPGNHILSDWDTVRASFCAAIDAARAQVQCGSADVATAVAGGAGIETSGETRGPIERLLETLVPTARYRAAVGDMVVAFHGALPEGIGAVILAGTGAVAYGQNAAGVSVQVDGWGPVLGDCGSAYSVGRAALRAAARADDGVGEDTLLGARLAAALGADTLRAGSYALYASPDRRERVASLAKDVAAAADAGDVVAGRVLADAGEALAETVTAVLHRLGLTEDAAPVATGGSLFRAGRTVMDAFERALAARVPQARVVPAALPPVGGAAKLAWAAAGVRWGTAEIARAQATHPG